MEASFRESGRMGARMAKDFRNAKARKCILEDSKMDGDTEAVTYTSKTGSIPLFTNMGIS